MRKQIFAFFACTAMSFAIVGCTSEKKTETTVDTAPPVSDSVPEEQVDTVPADTMPAVTPFVTEKFSKKVGKDELEMAYPVSGDSLLVLSVRKWLNEELGNTYKGKLSDGKKLFKHYASKLGDSDFDEEGGYACDDFEVEYENELILTYVHELEFCEGGEGSTDETYGTTFLRLTGERFDKKCITSMKDIQPLVVAGLKEYFKVKSDSQLLSKLNDGIGSVGKIPVAAHEPWIVEKGVAFAYAPYEIDKNPKTCPVVIIPFESIKPYLTEQGLKFFKNN